MNHRHFSVVAAITFLVPLGQSDAPSVREWRDTPAPVALVASDLPAAALKIRPESKLWLEGTSTVRSYRCEATEIQGEVRTSSDQPLPPLAGLAAAVQEAGITIPVARLDCNNGTMNGHMQKALKAKEHETITYRLDTFRVVAGEGDEGEVEMKGRLTIAGQEQPIVISAQLARTPEGVLRVKGQTELDMTTFGVEPPKLMFGSLKVHERVTVHFDVAFGS